MSSPSAGSTSSTSNLPAIATGVRWAWLPPIGSKRYYAMLAIIGVCVLGPLGGVTASYMCFSLGFFVGGQVLAGILGSVVTFGYGAEGKHGANFMQTAASSVASMSAMGVLLQAMVWLGFPEPPAWQLMLYFMCIGMFGVGVGMLYTPVLVDKMQLTYPSALAVANILRALTDVRLLKRSIKQLASGTGVGFVGALAAQKVSTLSSIAFSASTLGAGMIVGARIGIPSLTVGLLGEFMTPWLRANGWLGEHDPFRKIGFVVGLGMILGAAVVDLTLIFREFLAQRRRQEGEVRVVEEWQKTDNRKLVAWVSVWGLAVLFVAVFLLGLPAFYILFALALVFFFVMVNGISQGISDQNPISSAFVVTVLLMAALGLKDPQVGLLAAAVLLISTSVAVDMQMDRSTGWRLGTNRTLQFRYQVAGIAMGAVLAVVMAKVFMSAYPVLTTDTFTHPEAKVDQWQSAMTYKFVGALRGLTTYDPHKIQALVLGLGIGVVTQVIRKRLKSSKNYRTFVDTNDKGKATDFCVDALFLPSPYASSFAAFVGLSTAVWFGVGGIVGSLWGTLQKKAAAQQPASDADLPEDMSTVSLVGGGLIAGESLAALALGLWGLSRLL